MNRYVGYLCVIPVTFRRKIKMRKFQPKENKNNNEPQQPSMGWGQIELNTNAQIGIYARQSTLGQIKNCTQSTEMQTEDLVEYAKQLGWDENHIVVITQDLAKSGKLRIDQRKGMSLLMRWIQEDEIKTVLVFLEDRLFRDETGLQYNYFIDACKQHDVKVVTRNKVYDFSYRDDVKTFRDRCEAAADFLEDIHLRLHGAKDRLSASGRYAGRAIAVGFIVDKAEKIIVDGKIVPNPTYRKFIAYEPHAEIVRSLFKRFWELRGMVRPLCRELHRLPFVFPDFEPEVDVSQYIGQYHLKKVSGGYHISRTGLMGLLTNVAYIGDWIHLGEISIEANHEAIVDKELFLYAFNTISPWTRTGKPNEQKRSYTRYSRKDPIPALLKNAIDSREGGRVYVSTSGLTDKPIYIIEEKDQRLVLKYHAATPCQEIDELVWQRMVEWLRQTKRYEDYAQIAEDMQKEQKRVIKLINAQIAEANRQMRGIIASLSLPPEKLRKSLREKLAEDYDTLEEAKAELEEKRATLQSDKKLKTHLEYHLLLENLELKHEAMIFTDKQELVTLTAEKVYLDEMTAHWLRLEVEWRNPEWGTERIYLFRQGGAHKTWTDKENEIISELISDTPREEILPKMPRRSWSAILQQAHKLGVKRKRNVVSHCDILDYMSMEDVAFMQEAGIAMSERLCHKWETVRQQPP
jgi:predicted site-specific integrase-resolvase